MLAAELAEGATFRRGEKLITCACEMERADRGERERSGMARKVLERAQSMRIKRRGQIVSFMRKRVVILVLARAVSNAITLHNYSVIRVEIASNVHTTANKVPHHYYVCTYVVHICV